MRSFAQAAILAGSDSLDSRSFSFLVQIFSAELSRKRSSGYPLYNMDQVDRPFDLLADLLAARARAHLIRTFSRPAGPLIAGDLFSSAAFSASAAFNQSIRWVHCLRIQSPITITQPGLIFCPPFTVGLRTDSCRRVSISSSPIQGHLCDHAEIIIPTLGYGLRASWFSSEGHWNEIGFASLSTYRRTPFCEQQSPAEQQRLGIFLGN